MSYSMGIYRTRSEKILFKGENLTLKEWSLKLGIGYGTLWLRLYRYNLPTEKAFTDEKYLQDFVGRKITWGDKISKSLAGKKRKPLSEEHRRKLSRKGELSHMWIKDRTKLKIGRTQAYDYRYKEWMKEIKNRDRWQCKLLNEDCSGRLEAHHIVPWSESPELRYEVNNGITLCHYHHPRKRKEEQRLAPAFTEMVLRPVHEQAVII